MWLHVERNTITGAEDESVTLENKVNTQKPKRIAALAQPYQSCGSPAENWAEWRSEVTDRNMTASGDDVIVAGDSDSDSSSQRMDTNMRSCLPASSKNMNGSKTVETNRMEETRKHLVSCEINSEVKHGCSVGDMTEVIPTRLNRTMSLDEGLSIGNQHANMQMLNKRKRIVSPMEQKPSTVPNAESSSHLTKRRLINPDSECLIADKELIQPGDVELLADISKAARALEEIQSKCVKGLKTEIKGLMKEQIEKIGHRADALIVRYGSGTMAKEADIRLTATANRKIELLGRENTKLKIQTANLKKELEALRIRRNEALCGTPTDRDEQTRETYAQVAAHTVTARAKSDDITDRMRRMSEVTTETNDGLNMKNGKTELEISDRQLKAIVGAVAEALGIPMPPTKQDTQKPLISGDNREDPLSRKVVRREFRRSVSRRDSEGLLQGRITDQSTDRKAPTIPDESARNTWIVQNKNKRKRKKREGNNGNKDGKNSIETQKPKEVGSRKSKIPRTAAVVLNCQEGGTTYAAAIKAAMGNIKLETLGITNTKIRRARTGGLVIEIPRADGGTEKAEKLMEAMKKVVPGDVRIACPSRKIGIRVSGFHESTSIEEIREKIAGEIDTGKLTIGRITWNRGIGSHAFAS